MSDKLTNPDGGDPSQRPNPDLIMHETAGSTIDVQIEAGLEDSTLAGFLNNFEGKKMKTSC